MAAQSKPALTSSTMHTAGLFADRNLDGAEIGTLVIVIDKAKNLPNLKTMGKQNPYCAIRLGKEAKKTDTDHRGGQTPKWDQELRFAVYESLDYTKLKLSVFNEDKKTDLIGETFISLEPVLQRGGGQADGWHDLTGKGRYAGQVRIELTFYDSRPKEEEAQLASSTLDTSPSAAAYPAAERVPGPRDLQVKRRPLPPAGGDSLPAAAEMRANSVPQPDNRQRYHPTLPRQGSLPEPRTSEMHYEELYPAQVSDEPLQMSSGSWEYQQSLPDYDLSHQTYPPRPRAHSNDDDTMHYIDDPFALEAVAFSERSAHTDGSPSVAPLRHGRVQALSQAPVTRPTPSGGLPHMNSAPQLQNYERQIPFYDHDSSSPGYGHSRDNSTGRLHPRSDVSRSERDGGYLPHPPMSSRSAQANSAPPAPPPPVHRHSAPMVQPSRMNNPRIQRPYVNTRLQQDEDPYNSSHYVQSPSNPADGQNFSSNLPHGHSRSFDYGQSREMYLSDRLSHERYPSDMRLDYEYTHSPHHPIDMDRSFQHNTIEQDQARPSGYAGSQPAQGRMPFPRQSQPAAIPLHRPQAVSPGASKPPQQQIPRKSLSPRVSPEEVPFENGSMSTPYSPDSFAQINPNVYEQIQSNGSFDNQRDPSPMYTSSSKSTPQQRRPQATTGSTPRSGGPISNSPIFRSDGKVVDPSDHLPTSTYAPEPEPKGSDRYRNSYDTASKSRFGPREGHPGGVSSPSGRGGIPTPDASPVTTTTPQSSPGSIPSPSMAARNRLQKRGGTGPVTPRGSPLAPSPPGALNAPNNHHFAYQDHNSQNPPPVPGKIPFDTPQRQPDYALHAPPPGYDAMAIRPNPMSGGSRENAYTLMEEMSRIDLGPSPGDPRYGGISGRTRRSRFGA